MNKLFAAIILIASAVTISCIALLGILVMQISSLTAARNNQSRLMTIIEFPDNNVLYPTTGAMSAFDMEMRGINPDYVCWIVVEGTKVNYPVVRTSDNEKYLNTSFFGERNPYGAIFMDYRNVGEIVPHIIIYGHNPRDGSKFGSLRNFLNDEFLTNHTIITLKANDQIVEYEIFSARLTDIHDHAYFLDFSAPGSFRAFLERNDAPMDAVQIITLSTCVSRGDDDERLIVQGALIR